AQSFPDRLRKPVVDIVMSDLQATYRYDNEATERERQARFAGEPPVEVHKRANEILIPAGKTVDTLDVHLLAAERAKYIEELGAPRLWLGRLAEAAMIAMMAGLLWGYIIAYQPRIARKPLR